MTGLRAGASWGGATVLVAATASCGLLVGVEDAERRDDGAASVASSSGVGPGSGATSSAATTGGSITSVGAGGDGGGPSATASATASTGDGSGGAGGAGIASSGSGGEGTTGQGGDGGAAGGPSTAATTASVSTSTTSVGGGGPLSGWGEPCEDGNDCRAPDAECASDVCVPTGAVASWVRRPLTSPSDQATSVWLSANASTMVLLVREMNAACGLFRFVLSEGWVPVANTLCPAARPKLAFDGLHLVLLQGLGSAGSQAPTGAAVLVEAATPVWLPIGQTGQLDREGSVIMSIPQSQPPFFVHGGVTNGVFAQGYQRVYGDPDVATNPWIAVDELENEAHREGHAWSRGAPGEILIYGGRDLDESALATETCTLVGANFPAATWSCRPLAGPGGRYDPALVSFRNRPFLHGGTRDGANLTDTWFHDYVEDAWVQVVPQVTPADEGRRPPSVGGMAVFEDRLFHAGVRAGVELWELIPVGESCSPSPPNFCASGICAVRPGSSAGLCCDAECEPPATCFSDEQPGRCITP